MDKDSPHLEKASEDPFPGNKNTNYSDVFSFGVNLRLRLSVLAIFIISARFFLPSSTSHNSSVAPIIPSFKDFAW